MIVSQTTSAPVRRLWADATSALNLTPGPHRGERQDEGGRDGGVPPEPEHAHGHDHDDDARTVQHARSWWVAREPVCPASRCSAIQPPRSSPKVPMVAMEAALRPQRPISRSKLSPGMSDQAEQRADQRGDEGGRHHHQQQQPELAQPLEGDASPRAPDAGDPSAQRQDRDHGLEDGEQREERPGHSALGEEQDRDGGDREQDDVEQPRPTGAAGEPDQRDAGCRPHQADVVGLEDDDASEQAGADVRHQPCDCPSRPARSNAARSRVPTGSVSSEKAPPREAGTLS